MGEVATIPLFIFGTDFADYTVFLFFCSTKIQAPELFVRSNPPEAAEAFPRSHAPAEECLSFFFD